MEKWSRFFSKYLRFTRYFSGTYLRWRLQKIVSPGPQHVINQGNQLNQRLHLKKSSKSALKVAKKVTTFIPKNPPWKNSPICILCTFLYIILLGVPWLAYAHFFTSLHYIALCTTLTLLHNVLHHMSLHCKVDTESSKVYHYIALVQCKNSICRQVSSTFYFCPFAAWKPKILVNVGSPEHTLYSSQQCTWCHLQVLFSPCCILHNNCPFFSCTFTKMFGIVTSLVWQICQKQN